MLPTRNGSFRLFRVAGIDVSLHWLWFLVAIYEINDRSSAYASPFWNIAEYLTLFGIVLLHEFGHAFACRQVGGAANSIVLWPLGGVAYVQPPPRPGALLWSVAAGPLVNVLLIPAIMLMSGAARSVGWGGPGTDLAHFLQNTAFMNIVLLVFNLLPVYPLDGGQILQALLWFVIGRAHSLMAVSLVGGLAALGLILYAVKSRSIWLGIIALFVIFRCLAGFHQSRLVRRLLNAPRYEGVVCPSCGVAPPQGDYWMCNHCHKPFDTFQHQAVCPACGAQFAETSCPDCHRRALLINWFPAGATAGREPA